MECGLSQSEPSYEGNSRTGGRQGVQPVPGPGSEMEVLRKKVFTSSVGSTKPHARSMMAQVLRFFFLENCDRQILEKDRWKECRMWFGGGADGSRWRSEAVVWSWWKQASELRGAEDHQESGDLGATYGLVQVEWAGGDPLRQSRRGPSLECINANHNHADLWSQVSDKVNFNNRGVVQALNKGEIDCIDANHKDAEFWTRMWEKINEHKEQGVMLKVALVLGQSAHDSQRDGAT